MRDAHCSPRPVRRLAQPAGITGTRAARADTLDEVKKRGTLVVGMEAAYVPYEFFKDGKIIGYDPDIIDSFIPKLGVKAQLVDTAWNGIIPPSMPRSSTSSFPR